MSYPESKVQITTSNYLSFDGKNENLITLGGDIKLTKQLGLSVGVGNYWTHSNGKDTHKPAIEAKLKYNIGDYLNAQARFREIGGDEQYRITFGGSYRFDQHNSVYASVHGTAKYSGEWKYNTGGWLGYTYKFNNGISISGEIQQNIPLNNAKKNVGETIGCFNDSDKSLNVIVSIPITKK